MCTNAIRNLTSIIVPCWNQVEFTQQCLSALRRHTRERWELIVIDNGSTDATATYLAGVRDMTTVPVTVVSNAKNVGFPVAINQGLKIARGEYLVMLNNDVVVTDGWLDQLIALVNAKRSSVASGQWSVVADGKPADREGLITPPMEQPQVAPPHDGDALHVAESPALPCVGIVPGSAGPAPPPCIGVAPGSAGPTPPRPSFTRGGKMLVRTSGESGDAGAGEHGPANTSLPDGDCVLPTVRGIALVGPMSNYAAPPQLVE